MAYVFDAARGLPACDQGDQAVGYAGEYQSASRFRPRSGKRLARSMYEMGSALGRRECALRCTRATSRPGYGVVANTYLMLLKVPRSCSGRHCASMYTCHDTIYAIRLPSLGYIEICEISPSLRIELVLVRFCLNAGSPSDQIHGQEVGLQTENWTDCNRLRIPNQSAVHTLITVYLLRSA